MNRIDLYLNKHSGKTYANTAEEQALLAKFTELYTLAESAQKSTEEASPTNIEKWRKAYKGTLGALTRDGTPSTRKSRQVRKIVYEMIESKIDNSVPMPKITPRYKDDLPLVDITENYLKYEVDKILTKQVNDRNERATYIDGTTWYKVWWDSTDNTYDRSGTVKIDTKLVDQIVPQPGVTNYKDLEYIFEKDVTTVSRLYDLYGRVINADDGNNVRIVSCYYLNEDHIVGLFTWAEASGQVICNEHDWQIRKLRKCTRCGTINPVGDTCKNCGNKKFKYENATEEILSENLVKIVNPYQAGETDQESEDMASTEVFLTAGSIVPYYRITQLPFVPRPAISSIDSIYGMSEAELTLDNQDVANKVLTKAVDKTLKSGAVVTKPQKMKLGDTDDTFKQFGVKSAEEAQQVQVKQIMADTSQDIVISQLLYESARSTSGVTESFQGKKDTTATSGKAKEYAAALSAGRIESLRVMKAAAFAGVYELVLKYLLAFSDEPRKFVKVLPDGSQEEQRWSKYMFLDKDRYGNVYYRDDFSFSTDPAATLSQNRMQMWQETQDKFVQGAFGNPADPRVLKLFWNIMNSLQYPLAKVVIAGISDNEQHIPAELEQAIMADPNLYQSIMQMVEGQGEQRGGARPNSGPIGNGATHASNVERTNERNRASNRERVVGAQQNLGGAL